MVAILAVFNVVLIFTIWYKPQTKLFLRNKEHRLPPHEQQKKLINTLKLNATQQYKYDSLKEGLEINIKKLKGNVKKCRESYFGNIIKGIPSNDTLAIQLGYLHQLIEQETYNHFYNVRHLLSDSQKVTFDNIVGDIIKSLPEQPHSRGDRMHPDGPPDGHRREDFEHRPPNNEKDHSFPNNEDPQ
jgi:hypothetical protein